MFRKCALLPMVLLFTLTGCSLGAIAPPSPDAGVSPKVTAKASFEQEWNALLGEARKEGKVVIAAGTLGDAKDAMRQTFSAKYGIGIETMEGLGTEVVARVKAQRQAGLYTSDVGLLGISPFALDLKPEGISISLDPYLVMPEVLDKSKWRGGQLPFVDKEHQAIALVAMTIPSFIINTEMVKPEEIQLQTDLLKPVWKGKIVMLDPSTTDAGNNWFTHVLVRLYGREKGIQFMRDLVKQDPMVVREPRQVIEWVARGKYPVGIGYSMTLLAQFKDAGAPIGFPKAQEPSFTSSGSGVLSLFDKLPHPNATKVFANWLLSQEGGKVWAPAMGYPSLRLDVSNDHVDPALMPPAGIIFQGEDEYVRSRAEMRKVAAEIFK